MFLFSTEPIGALMKQYLYQYLFRVNYFKLQLKIKETPETLETLIATCAIQNLSKVWFPLCVHVENLRLLQ